MLNGFLLVDKPGGFTSHDVVAKVRNILRKAASQQSAVGSQKQLKTVDSRLSTPSPKVKVGHTGTLDPAASGLMILVLGKYTKRAGEFSKLDKTYEAELTLGQTSSTGDSEGELITTNRQKPEKVALEAVLGRFEGEISQTPPIYSAIKVDGQRAYKLARKGLTPVIEPRKITIHSIKLTDYDYPKVKIVTEVSSGTYIRTLAEDIGKELGTGAYMSALRRIKVGKFNIKDSLEFESLTFDRLTQGLSNHP